MWVGGEAALGGKAVLHWRDDLSVQCLPQGSGHAALSALLAAADAAAGRGSGRAKLEAAAPVEVTMLRVLRLLGAGGLLQSGGGLTVRSASSPGGPVVGRGAWAACVSAVDAALEQLRCRWSGLHPLSERARWVWSLLAFAILSVNNNVPG